MASARAAHAERSAAPTRPAGQRQRASQASKLLEPSDWPGLISLSGLHHLLVLPYLHHICVLVVGLSGYLRTFSRVVAFQSSRSVMPKCICGKLFETEVGLNQHLRRFKCTHMEDLSAAASAARASEEAAAAEAFATRASATKRARSMEYADRMRETVSLDLAQLRFVKLVPSAHVDIFKACVTNWLMAAAAAITDELMVDLSRLLPASGSGDQPKDDGIIRETVSRVLDSKLDLFDGLRTEHQELQFLKKITPMASPVQRRMQVEHPNEANTTHDTATLLPDPNKPRVAYDLKMDELLARLLEYSSVAREQIYETLVSWTAKPKPTSEPFRVVADITDGRIFLEHPVFGLQARMTEEEAKEASSTSPLKIGIMLYADAFTVRQQN
eukprot:6203957-Pleurochrysis_carterae.AAC.1